jgi:two-component system, LytTR family, response regulator
METQAEQLSSNNTIHAANQLKDFTGLFRNEILHIATKNNAGSSSQHNSISNIEDLLSKLNVDSGKKNFLVFKNHKYINIPTENIAFFYIKYGLTFIICFDKQEYLVNYSLEQIQNLVTDKQFFRLNRQYLINFNAVKEVEHYFARKLLVNALIPAKDKLLVSKEKVSEFLSWLDNR